MQRFATFSLHRYLLLLTPLLCAPAISGCHHCPTPVTPAPVVEIAKPPTCNLPQLPAGIVPNVGVATPDSIVVARSDFAQMLLYVAALRDWIDAAGACLAARGQ